jgi:DNA topoisomerase-1
MTVSALPHAKRAARLRRSDCSRPGLGRRRRGRGFSYLDESGKPIADPEVVERLNALVIPPAWREVWICPDPQGHLQATGIDDAGRKQYIYHPRWRERRDQQKFDEMLDFARALPRLRRRVQRDLHGEDLTRERALAAAVRLLDIGFFRVGSEDYAAQSGARGLSTILREQVSVRDGRIVFDYLAKGGQRQVQSVADPDIDRVVRVLKRRRGGSGRLLAYRDGRRWVDVDADAINDYLKRSAGGDFSAKDFRTWNATVLAAVALAATGQNTTSRSGRQRVISGAVKRVAGFLGNTPAVCRASYIDPRVFDRYLSGWTIQGALDTIGKDLEELDPRDRRTRERVEAATLDLIADRRTEALERVAA